MSAGRILALILGGLAALLAVALVAAGGVLVWAYGTQRDSAGFLGTPDRTASSNGYALTSPAVDLNTGGRLPAWLPRGATAAVRVEAQAEGSTPLFVGIGPADRVSEYLSNVAHDEIGDYGYPSDSIDYRHIAGVAAPPSAPAQQDFWVAKDEGVGARSVEWDVRDGNWTAVIMNSNAAAGVNAEMSLAARFGLLLPIGIGILVAGLALALISFVLVLLAVWRSRTVSPPPVPPQAIAPPPS